MIINRQSVFKIIFKEDFFIRKQIKFNNKQYFIKVYSYDNKKLHLRYENKTEAHNITLNLDNQYCDPDKVLLDPYIIKNGLINILKKQRIIREITEVVFHNNIEIPVAIINMGKLREYDKKGVDNYLKVRKNEN